MARYKVSFTANDDTVDGLVKSLIQNKDVQGVQIARLEDKQQQQDVSHFRVPIGGVVPCYNTEYTPRDPWAETVPPVKKKAPNGTPMAQTAPGRAILSFFNTCQLATPYDFANALREAGYAPTSWHGVVAGLIAEGVLYRASRGRYRRPTPMEELTATKEAAG